MEKNNIEELLKILPKLIRENETVKGAIISALSGVVATQDDILELNKTMGKRFETLLRTMDERFQKVDERFQNVDGRFETLLRTMDERFQKVDERFEQMEGNFEEIKTILESIQ